MADAAPSASTAPSTSRPVHDWTPEPPSNDSSRPANERARRTPQPSPGASRGRSRRRRIEPATVRSSPAGARAAAQLTRRAPVHRARTRPPLGLRTRLDPTSALAQLASAAPALVPWPAAAHDHDHRPRSRALARLDAPMTSSIGACHGSRQAGRKPDRSRCGPCCSGSRWRRRGDQLARRRAQRARARPC